MAIAAQRRETLRRFDRLKKIHTGAKAARMVGASVNSLWRWQRMFAKRGLAGLRPKYANCGQHSSFKPIRLSAQGLKELELLRVEQNSKDLAWQKFSFSAACPPLVARQVQRTGAAPAAIAHLGRINPVQARVFMSADGRRVLVKLTRKTTLTTRLRVPANK